MTVNQRGSAQWLLICRDDALENAARDKKVAIARLEVNMMMMVMIDSFAVSLRGNAEGWYLVLAAHSRVLYPDYKRPLFDNGAACEVDLCNVTHGLALFRFSPEI